ncbi:MAG: Cys-tRNA(Pro) deacylase [Corynebacterium sp.]|nr:Cys-tRNA(Pro) deacylase [Corynebacterium sp.]
MGKAATAALEILHRHNIAHNVHTFDGGHAHFGEHAAAALVDIEPERIFKTLVIDLTAGKGPKRQLAVCCLPVTHQLSLKKAASALHASKASMADPSDAQRSSGYIPGGISPLGQKHILPTVIEESAQLFDTIYVSGGKRGLDIELAPNDLQLLLDATYADILAE